MFISRIIFPICVHQGISCWMNENKGLTSRAFWFSYTLCSKLPQSTTLGSTACCLALSGQLFTNIPKEYWMAEQICIPQSTCYKLYVQFWSKCEILTVSEKQKSYEQEEGRSGLELLGIHEWEEKCLRRHFWSRWKKAAPDSFLVIQG